MSEILEVVKALAVLVMLSLSAAMIGANAPIIRMPIIAGYILAGVLVGPYALNLISIEQLGKLKFVNDFGLAIIAFSAGSELYFPEIR